MTTSIRHTKRFNYFEADQMGCTAIYDNYTGKQTNWNTGTEAEEEKEHIKTLNNEQFDEYCEMMTCNE